MRASGILLPIFSLPSKYGIGTFGRCAYRFVDQLEQAGQKYWQILPLGATGYGDSPYQSFSTFAGNPYFIDLEILIEEGRLTLDDIKGHDFGRDERYIDYEKIYNNRYEVLKKAYQRENLSKNDAYLKFVRDNEAWLNDYSLFMALKDSFEGIMWQEWPMELRDRKEESLLEAATKLKEEVAFYKYLQYLFDKQWNQLKQYANKKGVKIIGDIPIYVALDSADTWANSEMFFFDDNYQPIEVAGCPPDAFSATGQLWGNPIYDWKKHQQTGYQWWIERISHCFKQYDVVRIDHFRGFDEFYSIPYEEKTAEKGKWKKGPGMDLFTKLQEKLGTLDIIAEDLGYVTDSVKALLRDSGYPGMKVLQFAFDSREASNYLPHHYDKNCVVYTGTHDNDTLLGWYDVISPEDKLVAKKYLGISAPLKADRTKEEELDVAREYCDRIIRLALGSVADLAIIPIQDYLGLGSEARVNVPSTLGLNWRWRLTKEDMDESILSYISELTQIYER